MGNPPFRFLKVAGFFGIAGAVMLVVAITGFVTGVVTLGRIGMVAMVAFALTGFVAALIFYAQARRWRARPGAGA